MKEQLANFGWSFDLFSLLWASLWFSLAYSLWHSRFRAAALQLVLIAAVFGLVSHGFVETRISQTKSYREFMAEVNRRVSPRDKLVIYGAFNSDPVNFYRGRTLNSDERAIEIVATKVSPGAGFVIMTEQSALRILQLNSNLPQPVLQSAGKGPEGDAPLVLVQWELS